ncbi:unnamed protein product [Brachionus calyciflorus]|uniref:Uncharacterized protein n=1 Tax=Brachionus calyciflorus TaxID=104777 RepID=A0A813N6X0_9BILA|nr:unnamed protein product [Brachionus calyciflorus]
MSEVEAKIEKLTTALEKSVLVNPIESLKILGDKIETLSSNLANQAQILDQVKFDLNEYQKIFTTGFNDHQVKVDKDLKALDEKFTKSFDKHQDNVNKDLKALDEKFTKSFDKHQDKVNKDLKKHQENVNTRLEKLEKKFTDQVDKISKDFKSLEKNINTVMSGLDEKLKYQVRSNKMDSIARMYNGNITEPNSKIKFPQANGNSIPFQQYTIKEFVNLNLEEIQAIIRFYDLESQNDKEEDLINLSTYLGFNNLVAWLIGI